MGYAVSDYSLELCAPGLGSGPEQTVVAATSGERLDLGDMGYRLEDLFGLVNSVETVQIPMRPGGLPLMSAGLSGREVAVSADAFSETSKGLLTSLTSLMEYLSLASWRRDCYLRIGLNDGASTTYYRLYVVLRGVEAPYVPKTRHSVISPMRIVFWAYDPILYEDTMQQSTITVLASSGTSGDITFAPHARRKITRLQYYWAATGPNTLGDVTVTEYYSGIWSKVAGSTPQYSFACIDHFLGLAYGGPTNTWTSKMSGFSGTFLTTTKTTAKFNVTETSGNSFLLYVRWLRPAFMYFPYQES